MTDVTKAADIIHRLRNPLMFRHKAEVGEGPDWYVLDEDHVRADMKEAADLLEELLAELALQ